MSIPRYFHKESTTHPIQSNICLASATPQPVVYLVTSTEQGRMSQLMCSKTCVAPMKDTTVPRLELLSTALLSRLVHTIYSSLAAEIKLLPPLCYTDSKVSYLWIRGQDKSWKPFVQNQAREIRCLASAAQWHHCQGSDKPADSLSQGLTLEELINNEMWFHGPQWLELETDECQRDPDPDVPPSALVS